MLFVVFSLSLLLWSLKSMVFIASANQLEHCFLHVNIICSANILWPGTVLGMLSNIFMSVFAIHIVAPFVYEETEACGG